MAVFDKFQAQVKKDPTSVKKWVDATIRNQRATAMAPLAAYPTTAGFAGALSDLGLTLQGNAFNHIIDFENRNKAADALMNQQFNAVDTENKANLANSQNYTTSLAKQLGIQDALKSPGMESNQQQTNQLLAMNATNRANQQASSDILGRGYDEILNNQAGGYDAQTAAAIGDLYSQITAAQLAAKAAAGSGGGGGGGSRGGGSGSGSKKSTTPGLDFGTSQTPSTQYVIDPTNPPSGSTYSGDYVKPDVNPPMWIDPKVTRAPAIVRKLTSGGLKSGFHKGLSPTNKRGTPTVVGRMKK